MCILTTIQYMNALIFKQRHKLMSVPYLNLSYLPLRTGHSLLPIVSPLLLSDCLRLIPEGPFHDSAAPKILWRTSEGGKQTGRFRGSTLEWKSCSYLLQLQRQGMPERAAKWPSRHYWRGTMYGSSTWHCYRHLVHLFLVRELLRKWIHGHHSKASDCIC